LIPTVCVLYVRLGAADHRRPTEHSACQRSAAAVSLYFLTVTIFSRPNVWTFTNGFRFYCTPCLCTATASCKYNNTLYCISRQCLVGKSKRWQKIKIKNVFKYLFWYTAIRFVLLRLSEWCNVDINRSKQSVDDIRSAVIRQRGLTI